MHAFLRAAVTWWGIYMVPLFPWLLLFPRLKVKGTILANALELLTLCVHFLTIFIILKVSGVPVDGQFVVTAEHSKQLKYKKERNPKRSGHVAKKQNDTRILCLEGEARH
jgi:hypothetical protein